ncbi:SDR family oxidoreductase [Tautonia plasticadhaerens]|uniref:Sorbitol dehydrogenase n=1 Tax=Tautonia plasticadhaerens TaxID=2527974 RepID=A0A518H312_9BACT|nr:SDR family oxidoreductase [Tautonia plasticadhaerens]QDV35225.1 Sorbitol dehydrogenase [Tautonia plasticadhaerens]
MPRSSPDPTRLVVLTGATRGLGRAMLGKFAALGHTVAGCGRSAEGVAALEATFGAPHRLAVVDVGDRASVDSWALDVLDRLGPPDLLINNAALINRNAPLWEVPADEFDRVVDVNLKGVANVLRAFLPAMVAHRRGVIVNFSSYWGRSSSAEVAPYCATKFAVEGLTQALAQELPGGMAAVPFNPGVIDTDMLRSTFGGSASNYSSPDDWAEAAVPFLLTLGPGQNGRPVTAPGQ